MEISKALILAASRGKRAAPLTHFIPKAFFPIYDRPLIFYYLEELEKVGIKEVWIALEPSLGWIIEESIKRNYKGNLKIAFRYQEIIGGIGYTTLLFKNEMFSNFFVILGDEYTTTNEFLRYARNSNADITIGIAKYSKTEKICAGCNILIDQERKRVVKLVEKPNIEQILGPWCWSGYARFNPKIFPILEELWKFTYNKELDLTFPMQKALEAGLIIDYIIEPGVNINITTIKDFIDANLQEMAKRGEK